MSQTVENNGERRDPAQVVAEKFMQRVEQGLPLVSPDFPVNGRSGKSYNLVNSMVLTAENRQDPRWMTMSQINECGMSVRKGEHSSSISFSTDKEWREGPDGKKTEVKLERPKMVFARVFNGEQIEGMPPMPARPLNWDPQKRVRDIMEETGAKFVLSERNVVSYSREKDEIQVPKLSEDMSEQNRHYADCLRGLALRMNAPVLIQMKGEYQPAAVGSKDHVREQIRIEMATQALCATVGIPCRTEINDQSKAQWKSLLAENPKELFAACGQANRIVSEIQKYDRELDLSRDRDAQIMIQPVEKEQKAYAKPDLSKATFLKVAYEDRIEAQKLGARFDGDSKRWYAPEGVDPAQFKKFEANYKQKEHAKKSYLADKHEENRVYIKLLPKDREKAREKGATFDSFKNEWYIPKGEEKRFQKEMQNYQNRVDQIAQLKERVYLYVPIAEKDQAKEAGAKWDPRAKSWYAGENADMEKLARWSEIPAERNVVISPEDEFRKVMESKGLLPPEKLEMDGQGHTCKVQGDAEGKQSGFYIGRLDNRPNGYIKNNKTQETANWVYLGQEPLTEKESAQLKAESEKRARENAARRDQLHKDTARRVNAQLDKLAKVESPTPLMEEYGIANHKGLFQTSDGKALMAPVQDVNNEVWSMAYINANGREGVTQGGRLDSCFHIVDGGGIDALKDANAICICENVTTAMVVAETTGDRAVAAVMPSNLEKVAVALHEKFPDKTFVICGDDDKKLEFTASMNTGRMAAEKAAKAIDCAVTFPCFENNPDNAFSTFADMAKNEGRDMVGIQIQGVIEEEKQRKVESLAQTKEQKQEQEEVKTKEKKASHGRKL